MSEIECAQLHSELFRRRHSTRQSHGLFALAKLLLSASDREIDGEIERDRQTDRQTETDSSIGRCGRLTQPSMAFSAHYNIVVLTYYLLTELPK